MVRLVARSMARPVSQLVGRGRQGA